MNALSLGLASADALFAARPSTMRTFAARLRELEYETAHATMRALGKGVQIELRGAIRRFHLRQRSDAASRALRLFSLDDTLTRSEAIDALGERLFGALCDADAIAAVDDRFAAKLVVMPSDGLYILADRLIHGSDAVMGPGSTTTALVRATSRSGIGSALDVGCGAGTLALHLARRARRAIGTDINARAIGIATINAALNDVGNIEFRAGELFAPVEDEKFDLIASQPPFVAQPEGAKDVAYLYGGARGDEVTVRLLRELSRHLAKGGRAMLMTQWPRIDDRTVPELVQAALQTKGLSIVSLEPPAMTLNDYCAQYASVDHLALDDNYARAARDFRGHMKRLGARAITQALVIVEAHAEPIAASVELSSAKLTALRPDRIDARLAIEHALASPRDRQLAMKLRLARGVRFDRVFGASAPFAFEPTEPLLQRAELNAPTRDLLESIDAADDVASAIASVAARHRVPARDAVATLLPIVHGALRQGLLEPSA